MESSSSRPMPTRTLRRPGQQTALFMVGGLFALLGAGMLVSGAVAADPAGTVIYAVSGAGGVWLAFRSCFMGVRIDSAGLTARGLGRSKVVRWCAIGEVGIGDGPGVGPGQAPGLVLKNGERVALGALASPSSRAVGDDFALIKSLHAAHVTDCPGCG